MLVPSFFTSLTTVIGFLSLCSSNLVVIRRFGLWAGVGSLLEWVAVFGLLPALLTTFPWLTHFALKSAASSTAPKHHYFRKLRYLAVVVFVGGALSATHLRIFDSPMAIFPKFHPFRVALAKFKSLTGAEANIHLVFPKSVAGANVDLAPFKAIPGVVDVQSPFTVASGVLAQVPALFRPDAEKEFFANADVKAAFAADGSWIANVAIAESSTDVLQPLTAQARKLCSEPRYQCQVAGDIAAYSDFSLHVSQTLLESLTVSLLLVGAIIVGLGFALGKRENIAALVFAAWWGPITMILILVIGQVPINFLTSIFASALVGLSGDNSIQFLFASQRCNLSTGLEKMSGASVKTTAAMALGAAVFLLSSFDPPKTLGVLLVTGLFVSLFGDIFVFGRFFKSPRAKCRSERASPKLKVSARQGVKF